MVHKKQSTGEKKMTTKQMFSVVLQEMIDIRREILTEMRGGFQRLDKKIDSVALELASFRKETRLNQTTFIVNHDLLEKRVKKLEEKVGV
jgi:hypothetical protein